MHRNYENAFQIGMEKTADHAVDSNSSSLESLSHKKTTEGSLEVKLPTIWTDYGQMKSKDGKSQREEKSRREKIREEKESEERRSRRAKR